MKGKVLFGGESADEDDDHDEDEALDHLRHKLLKKLSTAEVEHLKTSFKEGVHEVVVAEWENLLDGRATSLLEYVIAKCSQSPVAGQAPLPNMHGYMYNRDAPG